MRDNNHQSANVAVGQVLRRKRQEAGLGPEALATKIGITRERILRYEQGQVAVPEERINPIADALGIDREVLRVEISKSRVVGPKIENSDNPLQRNYEIADVAFGRVLRSLRNERNLGQRDIAQSCGVSSQQIQKYECGSNRMSISLFFKIAVKLEMSVTDLMGMVAKEYEALEGLPHIEDK